MWWFFKKLNTELPYDPAIPLLSITQKNCSERSLCTNVQSTTIPDSQKVEVTWMSVNRWMDKQTLVSPHNGILFNHTKKWSADICYNVDESWKEDAKGNKPDIKGHIMYDSIYMKCPEKVNTYRYKADWWLSEGRGSDWMHMRFPSGVMKMS